MRDMCLLHIRNLYTHVLIMIVLGIAYSQVWRGDIIEGREMEIYRIEVWGFEVGI